MSVVEVCKEPTEFGVQWPRPQGLPYPRKQITPMEFLSDLISSPWSPREITFHQLYEYPNNEFPGVDHRELEGPLYTVYCFWGVREAHMMVQWYLHVPEWPLSRQWLPSHPEALLIPSASYRDDPKGCTYFYATRFYRLGCLHPNSIEINPEMFRHIYQCPDCGMRYETDSSG